MPKNLDEVLREKIAEFRVQRSALTDEIDFVEEQMSLLSECLDISADDEKPSTPNESFGGLPVSVSQPDSPPIGVTEAVCEYLKLAPGMKTRDVIQNLLTWDLDTHSKNVKALIGVTIGQQIKAGKIKKAKDGSLTLSKKSDQK